MNSSAKQVVLIGFGLLLLTMFVAQLVSFSHFNHIMRSYLISPGTGVRLLDPFILPIAFVFMLLHAAGAAGVLLLSPESTMRTSLIRIGVLAIILWFLLILSALIRDVPTSFVGFFGDKLRQPVHVLTLLQSAVFVVWGVMAYQISCEEERA